MDRGLHILGLMHDIQEMPEYQLYTQLQGFSISIHTFAKNYADLRNLITFIASDPRADSLQSLKNRDKLMLALEDVIRLLHNYVASVMSLIDHTRRLYNKLYAAGNEFTDYQARVDQEFVQDALAQFVQCLRLYCQHYKAPNLDITVVWNQGNARPTRTVSLLVEDLKTFDGWTPIARNYLDTISEKIEIVALATAYETR